MAWTPRVEKWSNDTDRVIVLIGYYDSTDTGFTNVLARNEFPLDPGMTNAAVRDQILVWGANMKTLQEKRETYKTNFPVGTTLPQIP